MVTARPGGDARTIHTLGARDSVLLAVLRDYFELTPERMQSEIQLMLTHVEQALLAKGIDYHQLRPGLVPQVKRREVALFFDTSRIEEGFYGYPIHARVIPLLSRKGTHSVLAGDYVGRDDLQSALYEAFVESVALVRSVEWAHSSQFYVVYINNLSQPMVDRIHQSLADFEPFVGSADVTYASRIKLLLSTMLSNDYLKHRATILMGGEDDVGNSEDVNVRGYPFEEFGYRVRSVQDSLFTSFLAYKIERPVLPGLETDTEFSIMGVRLPAIDLRDLPVEVEAKKFKYLVEKKRHHLDGLGLNVHSPVSDLEELIAAKIAASYIYDMSYESAHETTKFSIMLEYRAAAGAPFRAVAAFEYAPERRSLRLITLT